ncbi:MAG: hypothetical protein Q8M02_08470 [Candidatus Didemnitutus sp.]|nr:hypothetical protein [Candidatus Didemnitutus sp.]
MKWIVIAIVVFVVGYTLVNIYYRKPGRAFRPYEDMNNRATTVRLLSGGWQKLPVDVIRPTEKPGLGLTASVTRGANGLGAELEAAFAENPVLLRSIDRVIAPDRVERGADYLIHFSATLSDQHLQLGRIEALLRGQEIVLVPFLEKLPGHNLLSRWPDAEYLAELETMRLAPGRYTVRFAAAGPSAQWSFEVR